MKKNPRTAKIGLGHRASPIWLLETRPDQTSCLIVLKFYSLPIYKEKSYLKLSKLILNWTFHTIIRVTGQPDRITAVKFPSSMKQLVAQVIALSKPLQDCV